MSSHTHTSSTKRVLLVEERHPFAAMLGQLLKDEGFFVTSVATLEEAEDLSSRGSYDLIITDISMDEESGMQLHSMIPQKSIERTEGKAGTPAPQPTFSELGGRNVPADYSFNRMPFLNCEMASERALLMN